MADREARHGMRGSDSLGQHQGALQRVAEAVVKRECLAATGFRVVVEGRADRRSDPAHAERTTIS